MEDKLLSFKDIALIAKLGESRARTLRDRYEQVVPVVGEGRNRRYPGRVAGILSWADKLERSGKDFDAVLSELLGQGGKDPKDGRYDELYEMIKKLFKEVEFLRRREEWSRLEISKLKRKINLLNRKIALMNRPSRDFGEFFRRLWFHIDGFLDF